MIAIGRPINGISLNGLEYLLNDDGSYMEFNDSKTAKDFLRENGYGEWSDDEIEDSFMFVDLSEIN